MCRTRVYAQSIILFCAFLTFSVNLKAQLAFSFKDAPFDLGLSAGPSFFLGDLGGNFETGKEFIADLNLPATRFFTDVTGTIYPAPWLGIRGALDLGELYGNDAYSTSKSDGRRVRNLDFRTIIEEGYIGLEFDPLDMIAQGMGYDIRIHPYAVIGAGCFHFNPQGTYRNPATGRTTWIDLRPLHTEGEGFGPGFPKEYSLWQPVIPAAVGARYDLSERVSITGELLYRITFTGYIDDVHNQYIDPALFSKFLPPAEAVVAAAMENKSTEPWTFFSTRGDPGRTNAFFSLQVGLTFRLGQSDSWFGRANSEVRCPIRW